MCFCMGATARHLRVDPLLQGVTQLLALDWLGQGTQGGLEVRHRLGQVLKPAARTHVLMEDLFAFAYESNHHVKLFSHLDLFSTLSNN